MQEKEERQLLRIISRISETKLYNIKAAVKAGMIAHQLVKTFRISEQEAKAVLRFYSHLTPYTPTVWLGMKKEQYYEMEQDILDSLSLAYLPEQLKGEELDIYNKILENERRNKDIGDREDLCA